MADNAQTMPPRTEYSIAAKVFCAQAAYEVASAAVQLHGGYGLSKDYLVEKLFRDARAVLIEDGTNEVLGLAAVRRLTNLVDRLLVGREHAMSVSTNSGWLRIMTAMRSLRAKPLPINPAAMRLAFVCRSANGRTSSALAPPSRLKC